MPPPQLPAKSAPLLLDIVASAKALELTLQPPVYASGLHSLHQLTLRNSTGRPLTLTLPDTEQLSFQLGNENFALARQSQHNQLFNLCDHVTQLDIAAGESRQLILLFLAPVTEASQTRLQRFSETFKLCASLPPLTVHAIYCLSVFGVEGLDTQLLDFGDCFVGQPQIREFTVWNKSELDLQFCFNCDRQSFSDVASLSVVDLDSGEVADRRPVVKFRKIRLTFKAIQPADYSISFSLENLNNPLNHFTYKLLAFAKSTAGNDDLVLSEPLDYGDCYVGSRYIRFATLRNVGPDTLDLKLGCDDEDFSFQAKLSEDATSYRTSVEFIPSSAESQFSTVTSRASSPSIVYSRNDSSIASDEDFDAGALVERLHGLEMDDGSADIDEISLKPGSERVIEVVFSPRSSTSVNSPAGTLQKRIARLTFSYLSPRTATPERKTLLCKAQTCESLIETGTFKLDFGEVNVGTLKSLPLRIVNVSDMPAHVEIRFSSKILNTYRGEMIIPPNQFSEVKVDICPRKVNPEYRKQIFVVNLRNRESDQMVDICARNVDRNRVTFHSLFYKILTSAGTNFVDFGCVLLNNPTVRLFTIENISQDLLKIELTSSSPDEIQIYSIIAEDKLAAVKAPATHTHRKEQLLEAIDDRLHEHLESASNASPAEKMISSEDNPHQNAAYLDLAQKFRSDRPFSPRKSNASRPKRLLTMSSSVRITSSATAAATAQEEEDAHEDEDPDEEKPRLPASPAPPARTLPPSFQKSLSINSLLSVEHAEATTDTVQDIVAKLEQQFADLLAVRSGQDDRHLKTFLGLKRDFVSCITEGRLVPVSIVSIAPGASLKLVILFTASGKNRPYIQSKPKKYDSKIFLRLMEFDRSVNVDEEFRPFLGSDDRIIPVRELLVRSLLCRSIMEIGQKNINFGLVAKRERLVKTIVIYNRSETPLHYAIRKSGSIASGDLYFGSNRLGIIRAFGKREVDFIFYPSLPGMFFEKITVENLQDRENDQVVNVKAQIRKPSNFFLKSLSLEFGNCLVNSPVPAVRQIVIDNTSKQLRTFEVVFDPKELMFGHCFVELEFEIANNLDRGNLFSSNRYLSNEMEDQIEHLEQKLKIARRKGRLDKVKKIIQKLSELKPDYVLDTRDDPNLGDLISQIASSAPATEVEDIDDDAAASAARKTPTVSTRFKKTSTSLIFSIEPKSSKTVNVSFKAASQPGSGVNSPVDQEECGGFIYCHEHRNTDYVKKVSFSGRVFFNEPMYQSMNEAPSGNGAMTSTTASPSRAQSPNLPHQLSFEDFSTEARFDEDLYFLRQVSK